MTPFPYTLGFCIPLSDTILEHLPLLRVLSFFWRYHTLVSSIAENKFFQFFGMAVGWCILVHRPLFVCCRQDQAYPISFILDPKGPKTLVWASQG